MANYSAKANNLIDRSEKTTISFYEAIIAGNPVTMFRINCLMYPTQKFNDYF